MKQITIINDKMKFDLAVNEDQKIIDVLNVLISKKKINEIDNNYIRNFRSKELININLTFIEADILNGDELVVNI